MTSRAIIWQGQRGDQPVEPAGTGAALLRAFSRIRSEAELPEQYPPDAVDEARRAVESVQMPERDETAVPFITIDPPGAMDLDQAMHIERAGEGFRVRYAIADVPAFVIPEGVIDTETWQRGQTVYCPDERVPLHPAEISEAAASLLPDQTAPAYVWDITLDAAGEVTGRDLYRAQVRSTRRYDYEEVSRLVESGEAEEILMLLREVGQRRIDLEQARGGASLPMPSQEVYQGDDGAFRIEFRPMVPAEDWNEQISLLAGMVAASIMLEGRVGILRTMPEPGEKDVARFRRQALALGVEWSSDEPYGDLLRRLDRTNPQHLALIHEATALFRGASYTPVLGEVPEVSEHAAMRAAYAHVTAPLRRLVDRYGLMVCLALVEGREVDAGLRQALEALPETMRRTDQVAKSVDRACTDAVEVAELASCEGQELSAVVVDTRDKGVVVQVMEPAVVGPADVADGVEAAEGQRVRLEVHDVDVENSSVRTVVVGLEPEN